MGEPLVRAVGVGKRFGEAEVLRDVNLTVQPGEVVAIIGPSGSGKTTFLRLINQMESLTGGRIWVGGELVGIEERNGKLHMRTDKDIARQRARIGMVFQRFNLFPHMTAVENVMEAPVQVKGMRKAAARAEGDSFVVWTTAEVHDALRQGDFAGLVVNPAGPWAAVTNEELFGTDAAAGPHGGEH